MNTEIIKKFIVDWAEENQGEFHELSQYMFDNPELPMQETESTKVAVSIAEKHGFRVDKGVADMPTAFVCTYGNGKPVIGFSVELDALPGLSQKVSTSQEPVKLGAPGHGCGHCLLGPGALMAGIAMRYASEKFGLNCTIKIFGTPAEENCVGKPFMARAGLFDDVDIFLDWHPNFNSSFAPRASNAFFSKFYHFKGKTGHGNSPWHGKSALDAAMLMGHAVELLREHYPPGTESAANTLNYTFPDVGGAFPNVIPERTTAWYVGRFNSTELMLDVLERVDNCAKGAALATGTQVEMELITAIHEKIPNETISSLMHDNYLELGHLQITEDEQKFAKEMQKNAGNAETGIVQNLFDPSTVDGGVSDISEYSWIAPLGSFWPSILPGPALHHWVIVSTVGSSIGKKAITHAAKLLAYSGVDIVANPELVLAAKNELKERLGNRTYKCLVPKDIAPPVNLNKEAMDKYRTSKD